MPAFFRNDAPVTNFLRISGDFPEPEGALSFDGAHASFENDLFSFTADVTSSDGVYSITSRLTNRSDRVLTITDLRNVFHFAGGEYEVYTQFNGWQNESMGGFVPLITEVRASARGLRSCHDAAPYLVLRNRQTMHGYAFNLISDGAWEMSAVHVDDTGNSSHACVMTGICGEGLRHTLGIGETVELPEILCYAVDSDPSLGCYKLHAYLHKRFPRREMPVIYNTWLGLFDVIDFDNVTSQIPRAAELGCEYFVIDAGWFGRDGKGWWESRGDWQEKKDSAFRGRMREVSDMVREAGMHFGFWLEIECAHPDSAIFAAHPEQFIIKNGNAFLNFACDAARERILDTVCGLIDQYDARFIKFDFNADNFYDNDGAAFIAYSRAYTHFLKELREKRPNVYLENCASGGMRMDIRNGRLCDSYWLSDDQSPYDSMRIFKDTLRRLPPQWIEKWATLTSATNLPRDIFGADEKILATADAWCKSMVSMRESFLRGFLSGGPLGISSDLTSFSPELMRILKEHIASFKEERNFFMNAVCRVLVDTDTLLVLAYSDEALTDIRIFGYTFRAAQSSVCVFPAVIDGKTYRLSDGGTLSSDAINEDGIALGFDGDRECTRINLTLLHD